ncbi:MAG: hypothetical protein V2I43_07315 [Parvularcula sp.]|nr:hypothetical protein [Parvularcula sp.]
MSGNPYWEIFARDPLSGLERLAVIGTWRQDRRRSEDLIPAHCGLTIYARLPGDERSFFTEPVPNDLLWKQPEVIEPLNSLTRMSASFCGAPPMLMDNVHSRILTAWRQSANERFCSVYEETDMVLAGVIDREGGRVYVWFSAERGLDVETKLAGESFMNCRLAD